jgi:2-polyprenyl-3-methyl-5-hydroxy-6-metoxy-1,4-benzoquinol methylase
VGARTKLFESYTEHYRRGNVAAFFADLPATERRRLDLMYGPLLDELRPGSQVLDLGCGTGILLGWLATRIALRAVGIDASESKVRAARAADATLDVRLTEASPFLKLNPDTFSGIFCMDVLEHTATLDDCLDLITQSRDSLRADGFFVCKVPNAANLTASQLRYIDLTHERSFTSLSLLQLLEAGGFRDCRILSFRAAHLAGRVRLGLEHLLHRLVFRLCGEGLEREFTRFLIGVGRK